MGQSESDKFIVILKITLLLFGVSAVGFILYENRIFYHDDAYITLRYVHNLLSGNGVVWNLGEYFQGQGYTNFLFLMMISFLGLFDVDLQLATRVISFLSYFILLAVLVRFPVSSTRGGKPHLLQYMIVFLVATSTPILVWILGGLESIFYSLLCTLGVVSFILAYGGSTGSNPSGRYVVLSSLFFSLAALTRLDALLFMGLSGIFMLILKRQNVVRKVILFVIPAVLILLPYFIWVYLYYGDILPNTYYAKASGLSLHKWKMGIEYVGSYFLTAPFLFLFALLAGIVHVLKRKALDMPMVYLTVLVLSYTLYVISVGGDHMPSYRLLISVIPFTAMLMYCFLKQWVQPFELGKIIIIYSILIVLSFSQLFYSKPLNPRNVDGAAWTGSIVGRYIAEHWKPNSLIALNTAGSTPFFASDNTYIDMLGLNDPYIARSETKGLEPSLPWQHQPGHAKGDGVYVLGRKPDYIIVGPAQGSAINQPWFLSDLEMSKDPRFDHYALKQVKLRRNGKIATQGGMTFIYYQRMTDNMDQ